VDEAEPALLRAELAAFRAALAGMDRGADEEGIDLLALCERGGAAAGGDR
jgi:hypothetical protein